MIRDRNDWTRELKRFSDRNAGRSAVLEVDAAGLGAQREASGMKLQGVTYDPRDGRLSVMLAGTRGAHLTHAIPFPVDVDIVDGGPAGDVLRVGHADGQTLLRLRPAAPRTMR